MRCEINELIEKKTDTPFSLSSMASVRPFDSFALLILSGSHVRLVLSVGIRVSCSARGNLLGMTYLPLLNIAGQSTTSFPVLRI